ncbi:hypothetical protein [Halopiger xanaduensis]|uniref:AAA ATPase containing von Willebrand factor type A (VWA) domain-like protein n=1 Tax=Halopiger xanaduensis (strain DSM 18323 / JCM 14033 / SH-6) TaxID=797210 RepID=F8D750_HALXS|nr:hypothetical protein [Halopiger xanaduensis]AEH36614.1 AAA ATPase containing von Willebrand factor type A (vWA) domain-like protein [Halopiger xanaduensis SH-6]
MTTFADDDLEKRVENANGEVIGTVTDVDGEAARVKPRSGMVDSIKAALGWRRTRENTVTIRADAVDEITPETVRLEATPMDGTADTSTAPAADRTPTDPDGEATADRRADAESPTGIDDRMPNVAEAEPTVGDDELDRDRGIATDDSARGLETDDPDGELAIGDRANSTDADTDTTAADEPIGSATLTEPEYGPSGEGGAERELDQEAERDREGAIADDIEDQSGEFSIDPDTDSDPESEPEDRNSSPVEPLASSDIDGDERSETANAAADADEETMAGSDSDLESDDDSIDVADATATERPNRVGEPAIDEPVPEPDQVNESEDNGEEQTDEETMDLADEPNIGSGTRSLEDVGGSAADDDSNDGESRAESAAAEGNLVDEVDRGVDIESAVDESDSDAPAPDADSTDPADELEAGPDLEAAVESDESDDSAADGTAAEYRDESNDAAIEIEPGIDVASAMSSTESTSPNESESDTGPAGQRVDVDTGPGTAMHRELTDADESTTEAADTDDNDSDAVPEPSSDRTRRPSSESESQDRSQAAGSAAAAPIEAAIAAQRAALATNRTAAKVGATAQQNAARAALTGPLLAQRGTLEFTQTAARSYTSGVAAMMEMGTTTRTRRDDAGTDAEQSMDAAFASFEETQSHIADEELNRELAAHLERVRELQSSADKFEQRERIEQATELLERQTELLRRCQQHLEEQD